MSFSVEDIPKILPTIDLPAAAVPPTEDSSVTQSPGIPQSSAPPAGMLGQFGTNPWDQQDQTFHEATSKWYGEGQSKVDAAVLEPDKAFQGADLSFATDPKEAQRAVVVDAWMDLNHDEPVAPSDLQRRVQFQTASFKAFGQLASSEEELYPLIEKDTVGRRDGKLLVTDLAGTASLAAFQTEKPSKGDSEQTFRTWKDTAKGKPGYDPTREADYFEAWHEVQSQVKAQVDHFRPELDSVWKAFTSKGDYAAAAETAYDTLPDDQQAAFMAALSLRAKTLPEKEQASFWGNFKKSAGRDIGGYAADILPPVKEALLDSNGTLGLRLSEDPPDTKYDTHGNVIGGFGKSPRATADFVADVARVQQSEYDPMKYLAKDGTKLQVLEKGAYGAPGAIVTSASAAIPGLGMAAFYLSSQESIYQQFRQDFQDKGMSYKDAASMATNLAPIAAVPQVLMERIQLEAFAGKLPILDKVLNGLLDKVSSRVARFGLRTAVGAVEEGSLEQLQDLVPAAVQDIGHALEQDIPDVQWTGKGGVLDGYWAKNSEMIITMLPLAIFGAAGGISSDRRAQAFSSASTTELQALGIKAEGIAAINAASGQASLNAAVDHAMESCDATTPEAAAAVAERQKRLAETRAALVEAQRSGVMPALIRTQSGWAVHDGETGEEIGTAPTAAGAWSIAKTHSAAIDNLQADYIAYLSTMMEATDAAHAIDNGESDTTTRLELGTIFTEAMAAAENPAAAQRYADQVALKEKANGGDGSIAYQILGNSKTNPDSLKTAIRQTVNRLFVGASVTDVFHETFHGFRREARAAGRITREDEIAMLRSLDTVLAGKLNRKDGTPLRFIADGMTDDQISETHLDEAFSEIGEMEILRSRTDRTGKKALAAPGIITRNLKAIARLAPEAARKLSAFIDAVRAQWGLALSRAIALKKAERDGKFDSGEYDAYLAKMLGLDQQDQHLQDVAQVGAEIVGVGDPFSIGRAVVLPPMTQKSRTIADPAPVGADLTADLGTSPDSISNSFQSAPGKPGDGGTDTSFSIARAREIYEKAINSVNIARQNVIPVSGVINSVRMGNRSHGASESGQFAANWILRESNGAVDGYRAAYVPQTRITGELIPLLERMAADAREYLAQAEADLYLAEEDFDPETDSRLAAAEAIHQRELSKQSAMFAALLDARDEEAKNAAKSFVAKVWNAYGQHDDLFQFEKSTSKDAEDIAEAVSVPGKQVTATESGDSVRFAGVNGHLTVMDADTDRPYIAASQAGSKGKKDGGGSQLYVAALDWIHNNGKRIKDDPAGITGINMVRRTSNFFASSIRWGTTKHLKPHAEQKVGKWTKNDVLNTSLLATKEMENVHRAIPETRGWTFDFRSGSFLSANGEFIPEPDIAEVVGFSDPANSGIGISTLQRAVVTASAIQEFQRGSFASVVESAESDLASSLTGVSYSLGSSRMIESLNSNAISRIQSPARRHEAMSKLSRKLEDLRLAAERLELMAGVKRLKKSIRTEAKRIEETRLHELEAKIHADFQSVLTDDDLQRIKAQPVHEYLSVKRADGKVDPLHGRLMSLAAASKKHPDFFQIHRPGDYDGADGISRTVYGGTLMPDQAAHELYNHTTQGVHTPLISADSTDALWDALRKEQDSVAGMKEQAAKAKDRMREARNLAKKEANDWLATQVDHQAANFSDKQEIVRALAVLDGILSVVPAEIRGRVGGYTQLATLGSNETRMVFLSDKIGRVDAEIERWLKSQYDREFRELLQKARPAKEAPGEKPKGKITATIHELFKSIEASMGMTAAVVEAEAVKLESLVQSGDYSPEEENHMTLEANLIRLAGNWANASAAQREMALKEATSVYQKGYLARQKEISFKREETKNRRGDLAKGTGKSGSEIGRKQMEEDGKKRLGTAKKFFMSLLGWEQIVGYSFGDATPEAIRLVDAEREAANSKSDALGEHWNGIEELFIRLAGGKGRYEKTFAPASLKGSQIRARLSERQQAVDKDGKPQKAKGIKGTNGIYYSEMEAIQATLMWMQEDGKRHMLGHQDENGNYNGEWHYDQDFVDSLEDGMSEEAKAVRLHLMEHYAAEYDRLNPIYKALNGVNLPRHKFYSPLTVKPLVGSGQADAFDPVTGAAMSGAGFTPGSLKTRGETIAQPDFRDALQTFERHVMQMEHWMAYAEFSSEANQILNNRTLKQSVEEKAGAEATALLDGWVKLFAAGGTRDASAHLAATQAVGQALNRAAAAALVGRASVIAVQSVQLGAALNAMPTGAYIRRLAKLTTGNLGWADALGTDYIQRRLKDMPPVVRQALAGLHTGTPSQLKHQISRLGHLIGGADALFTAGTYAMIYDYQLKVQAKAQGLTGQEAIDFAHREAERETDRVAQPTRAGARSYFENVSTSPAMKLAWAFASEPRQKMALAIYNLGRKDVSAAQKARSVFVAYGVGGILATMIRAVVRDMRDGGDDDELFDERNWDPKMLALQALTSPLQGIPFVGDGLQAVGAHLTGQYMPDGNLFSAPGKAAEAATKIKGHIEAGDTMHTIRDVEDILTGFALGSDSATAAASAMHILRDLYGVGANTLKLLE